MSPRPSSTAVRRPDTHTDFEWPPAADELAVYDVGPDPWQAVRQAPGKGIERRRESPQRTAITATATVAPTDPHLRGSRRVTVAIAGALAVAVLTAFAWWGPAHARPRSTPVETVHHPAPPADTSAPPRLKIVATYPIDPTRAVPAAVVSGVASATTAPIGSVEPRVPVTPTAAQHALSGLAAIDMPTPPIGATETSEPAPDAGVHRRAPE